jgi:phytoene desaturase
MPSYADGHDGQARFASGLRLLPNPRDLMSTIDQSTNGRASGQTRAGDRRGNGPIAVVGAGPGGLAAAMLLAASGAEVVVYEAQARIGGRTARLTVPGRDGHEYHFDTGPTFFLMPYVLEEIFKASGRDLHDYVDLRPLDPMYRLIIGRQDEPGAGREPWTVDATTDIAEMSRRLAAIDERDGAAFERFIADNRAKLAAAEPILRRPIRGLFDLMKPDAAKAGLHIKPHLTVHSLLSKYFQHPAVRLAVSFQSKYLGMSPYDCPSLFTILPFIEYEYGIWHPIGGCNALMAAMAKACEEMGVRIETSAPVERVAFDESGSAPRATGVVVHGEHRACSDVVVNADATWALKKLVPERLRAGTGSRDTDAKLDAKKYSCSTYMLYLGLEGAVDLPHHTIYVSERYRQNLDDISQTGELTEDASVYVHNPSPIDPSLAPEGNSSIYVLLPTANLQRGADWSARDAAARELVLNQLDERFGISDVESRIVAEKRYTPADWAAMNINHGATFNLAHNLGQMLHKRPQHRVKGFDGLWLVGGGTHPGSGLPVIFLSSQITARMLCEERGFVYAGAGHELDTRAGAERSRAQIAARGVRETVGA